MKTRIELKKVLVNFKEGEPNKVKPKRTVYCAEQKITSAWGFESNKKIIVWHGTANARCKVDKYSLNKLMLSYVRRQTFPKTRDKDKSKRNNFFSSFNKLWQREYSNTLFTQLTVQFNWLQNKLNNLGRRHRLRGSADKRVLSDYREKFFNFWHFSIFGFLLHTFCFDYKIVFALITNQLVFVNGEPATNPFTMVNKLSIVKIDLPDMYFVFFELLRWKLRKAKHKSFIKKSFFLRFSPPTNTEVSFKTSEIFLLPLPLSDSEHKRSFVEINFSPALLFSQRFFPKQKKFGLGRLI